MQHIFKRGWTIVLFTIVLGACSSSATIEDTIEKATEAQKDVETYMVEFDEKAGEVKESGEVLANKKDKQYEITLANNEKFYMDKDSAILQIAGEQTIDMSGEPLVEQMGSMTAFFNNPYEKFEEYDNNYEDLLEVEEKEDTIVLKTKEEDLDEDALFDFAHEYLNDSAGGELNIEWKDFDIKLVLDKETHLLQELNIESLVIENGEEVEIEHLYDLSNYDDIDEIEKLELTDTPDTPGNPEGTGEDMTGAGDDAAAYVDALIQATIFQDEKEFIKRAPDSMGEEAKESEAKLQKEGFKEIYIENTKANMQGLDIKEEEFEELADSFIQGLSNTSYEIKGVEEQGSEAVVIVEIEGIDDAKMHEEIQQTMMEELDGKDFSDEEMFELNFELLKEEYKNVDITKAKEVEVLVTKVGENYLVQQDDYMVDGFIRSN